MICYFQFAICVFFENEEFIRIRTETISEDFSYAITVEISNADLSNIGMTGVIKTFSGIKGLWAMSGIVYFIRYCLGNHSAGLNLDLMERKVFPLLIKILDAQDKLSLQVHPPPGRAAALGGGGDRIHAGPRDQLSGQLRGPHGPRVPHLRRRPLRD